jgi:outer membrane receptor protein involved in Fe transport
MNMIEIFCFAALAAQSPDPPPVENTTPPAAASQSDAVLEEVIVTAQLRDRTLAETPVSVTVLDAATLAAVGQQHLQDVLALVPNLNWAAGSSRPRYFQIRGIGELDQWQGAPNPSVGLLIDDVDFSGIGTTATLFDVEQVEVVRGPQGVTHGANALAGLIAMRTSAPRDVFGARAEASVGDFGLQGAGVMVTGPIGAQPGAYRLAVQRQRSDGFRTNRFLGREDTNGYDELTARAKLRLQPSDVLTANLSVFWIDVENGYDAFSIDNSRVTRSDMPGEDAQRSRGGALRLDYDVGEKFAVRSVSAWAESDIAYSFDGDWGNADSWGANGPYEFRQEFDRTRRVVSQDLRLLSPADASGREWVAGVYAARLTEGNLQRDIDLGSIVRSLDSDYRASNLAGYGELSWNLGARASVAAGVRVERREASYRDNEAQSFRPTETMWGGSATFRYSLPRGASWYATAGSGYKAGGFNIGAAVPADRREFSAEKLESFELGFSAQALDDALRGSLAVFFMRRLDQQVETSFQQVPGDPLTYVFFTDNAARGANWGLEASGTWRVTDRWTIGGALGLLRARITNYQVAERDLRGRDQPHAPRYQFATFGEFRHPRGWFVRLDFTGTDRFYFSSSHDERSRAYTLANAKVGFDGERFSMELWARNLFDEYYSQRGFFFGNEPPDFPNKRYLQAGDPRHWGVTVRYHLGGQ